MMESTFFNDNFFLKLGAGLVGWLVVWFVKLLWDRNVEVRRIIADFKKEVRDGYQNKELAKEVNDSMRQQLDQIQKTLEKIDAKLDKKADK